MIGMFDRFKATALLVLLAGYLIFNYAFMQLRIPPASFGVPLGELFLAIVLLTTDLPRVLSRMGATVFLLPFMVWWIWGTIRLVFDIAHEGFWSLRDATQLMESLFLVAGFTLAGQPDMLTRTARWLRNIILVACPYGLLFGYADDIAAISPTIPGASGQPVPIVPNFASTGTIMLWGAFFFLMSRDRRSVVRTRNGLIAGFLVAFTLLVIQARTTYPQLLVLAGLMLMVRPRSLKGLGSAIPVLLTLLAVISAFNLQIAGRLTSHISLSFFWEHLQSIFGVGADGHGGLASAAEGVDLRMGWWMRIYDQMTADPVKLITGLGFGIPLTDFRDSLGVVTREPHNSIISVTARMGLIGIFVWAWMQLELFRATFRAFRDCRRNGLTEAADLLLLILAFAVLTLASCMGEDTMEKPYNAIPYYAFWGVALRIAYELRVEAARARAARADPHPTGIPHPSPS
jgi:hypothetical protein